MDSETFSVIQLSLLPLQKATAVEAGYSVLVSGLWMCHRIEKHGDRTASAAGFVVLHRQTQPSLNVIALQKPTSAEGKPF